MSKMLLLKTLLTCGHTREAEISKSAYDLAPMPDTVWCPDCGGSNPVVLTSTREMPEGEE